MLTPSTFMDMSVVPSYSLEEDERKPSEITIVRFLTVTVAESESSLPICTVEPRFRKKFSSAASSKLTSPETE